MSFYLRHILLSLHHILSLHYFLLSLHHLVVITSHLALISSYLVIMSNLAVITSCRHYIILPSLQHILLSLHHILPSLNHILLSLHLAVITSHLAVITSHPESRNLTYVMNQKFKTLFVTCCDSEAIYLLQYSFSEIFIHYVEHFSFEFIVKIRISVQQQYRLRECKIIYPPCISPC